MLLFCAATIPLFAAGRADVAEAVMRGDQAALRRLLQQKADVNAAQVDGATALHWAVYRDDVAAARLLLNAGARSTFRTVRASRRCIWRRCMASRR